MNRYTTWWTEKRNKTWNWMDKGVPVTDETNLCASYHKLTEQTRFCKQ